MFRNSMTRAALSSAGLAVILASHATAAVNAKPDPDAPKRVVKFADLDITRTPGAAKLYSRITGAARAVCEPSLSARELGVNIAVRTCEELAIERAVNDVNAPALTSYHQTKVQSSGDRR